MAKSNRFWTPTKVIVTILIAIVLGFILFKLGVLDFMNLDTLFIGGEPTPQVSPIAPGVGGPTR